MSQNPPSGTPASGTVQNFHEILKAMLSHADNVSDLIFSPGRPPQVEHIGKLHPIPLPGLDRLLPQHTAAIAKVLVAGNEAAAESLERTGSADVSYSLPGMSRFRVNVFKQRGTIAIVMRVIPNRVPTFRDLNLPEHLKDVVDLKNGIVLVTGPTGSGKSSTLAAIVDEINQRYAYHIVTIEDPIEFLHPHKLSTVHQRELHTDTDNFASALRAALRQAPKVILVGEMRDLETVEVALDAAETGHLVFSTLHTTDAAKTVDRIIGIFPKTHEQSIRQRLSTSFRYIVSQRLLPRADGKGRIPAVEILRSTMRTREYIEKGEAEKRSLIEAMRAGDIDGMQDFDTVLEKMVREGLVTFEDGLAYATNKHNLRLSMSDLRDPSAQVPPQTPPPRPAAPARPGMRSGPPPDVRPVTRPGKEEAGNPNSKTGSLLDQIER
ncbi:MAG: PilT/PilU family type 4a pilus ATPase [Blastocatellia bacterium]|nr:PilT/PilU family type 4a pilus ATPase [Blastocatellia bacterium]